MLTLLILLANIGNNRNNNTNRKFVNSKKTRGGKMPDNNFPMQSNSAFGHATNQQTKQFYKNGMLNTQNSQVN